MASSESAINLDLATYVSITIIVVSLLQLAFFWYQRQRKNCGWEVLYVTAVEPLGYLIGLVFPAARVALANGTSIYFVRYASWLATCPVLLILLTNMPRGKYKRPQDTLVALVSNQLMIVFGVAAIFYTGAAKAILFVLGTLAGGFVFKTAMFTFLRASESFPKEAKTPLWIAAACFFIGWLAFPILWLMGPEGYGSLDFGVSQMVHALADLVSKNAFGALTWYVRFMVIKPWEQEQKRLRKEAEAKERESQGEIVDPAYERAYDGGYGPADPVGGGAMVPLAVRRTPATIAACTSVLETARRFVEKRRVRVLLVEEEAFPQRQMLDAFAAVNECDVQADVLFSIEDVPRLVERGSLQYSAIFVNADVLQHLVTLSPDTVREMNLNVFDEADFRDELRELRRAKRKGIRKVQKAKDAAEAEEARGRKGRRSDSDDDDEDEMYLYDSDADGRAALEDAELHPTQRLFGARTVVAYRLGAAKAGAKKVGKDDKRPLGFNVLLRHPTDPAVMSRVFTRLAAQAGVTPAEIAEDRALENVMGAVEATAMAAQADAMAEGYGGYGGGYGGGGYGGGYGGGGGGGGAPQFGVAVPRQNSSMDTLGAAFHGTGYEEEEELDVPAPARVPTKRAGGARSGRAPPRRALPTSDSDEEDDPEDTRRQTRPAAVAPPPPSGRKGSARQLPPAGPAPRQGSARRMPPASPAPRQGSFAREMSTAFDTYDEAGPQSSVEDVSMAPARGARAARAGKSGRRRR